MEAAIIAVPSRKKGTGPICREASPQGRSDKWGLSPFCRSHGSWRIGEAGMHTVEMLDQALDLAGRLGYTVRQEWLAGGGGAAAN